MSTDDDRREWRLRRYAEHFGYRLAKARRAKNDPLNGTYHLIDKQTDTIAVYGSGAGYGLTLDEVEAVLEEARVEEVKQ